MTAAQEMLGRFEVHELPNGGTIFYDPDPAHAYYTQIKKNAKSEGGYSYVQGSRLAGVSTVAKFVDPPGDGLLYWAAGLDQVGIATLADRAIKADADLTWLSDPGQIRERLREEELTWADIRDMAATRGTNVHEKAILELSEGRIPNLKDFPKHERGYAQAMMAWWVKREPVVLQAETTTGSLSRGFAGRFDLRAVCDLTDLGDLLEPTDDEDLSQMRILVDGKSREKGQVRMPDWVQLAGYEAANVECGIGSTDRQLALILMEDGTFREEWSRATATDFYAALTAYKTNKSLGRMMAKAKKARGK